MGIVNTLVYVSGGLTCAYVTYQNALALSNLAKVEGFCRVLRDGNAKVISSKDLVPGDVVIVSAGPVTCDMVLIEGELLQPLNHHPKL